MDPRASYGVGVQDPSCQVVVDQVLLVRRGKVSQVVPTWVPRHRVVPMSLGD